MANEVFEIPAEAKQSPAFEIPAEARLNDSAEGFKIPVEAQAAHSDLDLLDKETPEQLAARPDFRPADFHAQRGHMLTPEQEDKLATTYRLIHEKGITGAKVVQGLKQVPEGIATFGKGIWKKIGRAHV